MGAPSGETPQVSVLVVSRDRPDRLRACLRSVEAQDHGPCHVHVLANGCEETARIVREEFPGVRLTTLPENVGSAPGRNRIASEADGEWLLFLDDDGEIRDPATLSRLVQTAGTDPRAGVISMGLLNAANNEPTGWRRTLAGLNFRCYHAAFAGGASLVRARAFREAGGYSERFTGPGEEYDLTVRLYAAGWAVVHFPDVVFHHHVDKTDEHWRKLIARGYAHLQYTLLRLYPFPWHLPAAAKALATQCWIDLRHHGGIHIPAQVLHSLRWGLRGLRDREPVSRRALELLYFAKYHRVEDWAVLERAPPGLLRRVLALRVRRKITGQAKLPLPAGLSVPGATPGDDR